MFLIFEAGFGDGDGFGVGVAMAFGGVPTEPVDEPDTLLEAIIASMSSSSVRSRENLPEACNNTFVSFADRMAC